MFAWNDPPRCEPAALESCGGDPVPVTEAAGCDPAPANLLDGLGVPEDEYAAAKILFRLRFRDGWDCEHCGHLRWTHLRTRPRVFECNRCGHPHSVTAGTSLHRCRIPLVKVVAAARLLARAAVSVSARSLARILDVGIEAAWALGHRLRVGFLEVPPARLSEDVVLSSCGFRRRKERGEPPGVVPRPVAWFSMLWDWEQRAAGITGDLDRFAVRRFLDRHTTAATPTWGPLMLPDPGRIGDGTHRGVSERWLAFYVAAIVGWRNARLDFRDPALVTLGAALQSRRHPFRRLRPKLPETRPLDLASGERAHAHLHRLWSTSVQATMSAQLFERYLTTCSGGSDRVCAAADRTIPGVGRSDVDPWRGGVR